MPEPDVPFSRPSYSREDLAAVTDVLESGALAGGGRYTRLCHEWLEKNLGCRKAFLTGSGTQALEMACLLLDLRPGDEVILPSFTFSSSANAIVLRGAVPVFVDVRPDTLNLDEREVEGAITARTRAVMPVHYAGVGCAMADVLETAQRHGLAVIEDAAQAVCASYRDQPLGSLGEMGALSFHVSKNVSCGEGGALLINDDRFSERAELLWEKGTNRARFLRGEVDKYTWDDLGSSFLPSEIAAALLFAQLSRAQEITDIRRAIWSRYHEALAPLEDEGLLRRPRVPQDRTPNGHIYFVLLASEDDRDSVMQDLRAVGVATQFHYVPLHSSPAGRRFGRAHGSLEATEDLSGRLLRLPLFPDLTSDAQERVVASLSRALRERSRARPRPAAQVRSVSS